jgi:hypothetical protein
VKAPSRGKGLLKPKAGDGIRRLHAATHPRVVSVLRAGLPPSFSQMAHWPRPLDQSNSSTCVEHSAACAIYVSRAARGQVIPLPSPRVLGSFVYADTQRPPGSKWQSLADIGSTLQAGADAVSRWGVRPLDPKEAQTLGRYSDVPSVGAGAFPEATPADVAAAYDTRLKGEYSIPVDTNAPQLVAAAIVAGMIPQRGGPVGPNYENSDPSVACGPDLDGEGHATCDLAYRTNPTTGQLEFGDVTSWGAFGVAGSGLRWTSTSQLLSYWEIVIWDV